MKSTKTYFLCTDAIEHSFALTEVQQAASYYAKVVVVLTKKTSFTLPANVEQLCIDFANFKAADVLKKNKALITAIVSADILRRSFNFNYYKSSKQNLNYLLQAIHQANCIEAYIKQTKIDARESVFVSFWFNSWAIALAVLKKRKHIPAFYSRAHGTDLFEYRVRKTKRIPFRKFQLKWVDKVFSVSKNGQNYLKLKYPRFAKKVSYAYLGTEDNGLNPFSESSQFTIVSCATVRNIKRIYLIPEILQHLNFAVKWIHLGDENLNAPDPTKERYLKNKKSLLAFPKITAEFPGNLSNDQIFEFYQTTPVNLFISVSETEGLPVSIMEAISFGIPVMATDVGGCAEIACEQTGSILPKKFNCNDVAKQITEFKESSKNTESFRKGVRLFWEQHFEVTANYTQFFKSLEK